LFSKGTAIEPVKTIRAREWVIFLTARGDCYGSRAWYPTTPFANRFGSWPGANSPYHGLGAGPERGYPYSGLSGTGPGLSWSGQGQNHQATFWARVKSSYIILGLG